MYWVQVLGCVNEEFEHCEHRAEHPRVPIESSSSDRCAFLGLGLAWILTLDRKQPEDAL